MLKRGVDRETFQLRRGDFLRPEKRVAPGVPAAFCTSFRKAQPVNRLTFARMAGRSPIADDSSLDRQSDLADLLWNRDRRHPGGLRTAERRAIPP
jgi:hypothetical protein